MAFTREQEIAQFQILDRLYSAIDRICGAIRGIRSHLDDMQDEKLKCYWQGRLEGVEQIMGIVWEWKDSREEY